MPRVRSLSPTKRQLEDLSDFIKRKMRQQNLNQTELAEAVGLTQQNLSIKLRKGNLRAGELIDIFHKLEVTKEEAGEMLTL